MSGPYPSCEQFPGENGQGRDNRSFFGKDCERKPYDDCWAAVFDIREQTPERECAGGEVEMREGTLGEEDRIERCANGRGNRNFAVGDSLRQTKHTEQREGGDQQHGGASHGGSESENLPR